MARTIIVTGANGNLGSSVVKYFLEGGDKIIALGRGFNNLSFAKDQPGFEQQLVDLASEESVTEAINKIILTHKSIDAAFLLVGGFAMGKLQDTSSESVRKMIGLNFETAYIISRVLFEKMTEARFGRIVFVGARPAIDPKQGKNMIAYALSKSLLFTLAGFMNEEGKGKNVITSIIVPSTIDTPDNRKSMPEANTDNWVKPEQIAELLDFISSEKANAIREPVYKIYNNG